MAVYTAINPKLESRGKIVGGDGKNLTENRLLDRSLIESRGMGFRRKDKQALTGLF